jgi:hypothetical protein
VLLTDSRGCHITVLRRPAHNLLTNVSPQQRYRRISRQTSVRIRSAVRSVLGWLKKADAGLMRGTGREQ